MAITDLFSKRQKRLRGEVPDVYVYDEVPYPLRVQLAQIIGEGIGSNLHTGSERLYGQIHKMLCREYGVFSLVPQYSTDDEAIANYLLTTKDVEHVLDVVEICLRMMDTEVRSLKRGTFRHAVNPDESISEVNKRFQENGVGYEFTSGEIIRIDSKLLHSEVVKPALSLIADPRFSGANDEFLRAHEHYRHGRYKECLNEALRSFESAMKTICDEKGWAYSARDTAKALIDTCMSNGLFPTFMQTHVANLRMILESGVPTTRNKQGGHGQGSSIKTVTQATASFALHTAATNILFFVESAQLPKR